MIELSTVEAAVQECSQALDETMYGDIISFYSMFMGVGSHSFISDWEINVRHFQQCYTCQ